MKFRDIDIFIYSYQFCFINTLVKIGLATMLFITGDAYMPLGYFNFLSLYGTLTYITLATFEYLQKKYILMFVAIIGIIVYQPVYPVIKNELYNKEFRTYPIILAISFFSLAVWIIYDFIRMYKNYKDRKIST